MNVFKTTFLAFGLIGTFAAFSGCQNQPTNNQPAAECGSDRDCNRNDKCRVCSGGKCVAVSDCCTVDSQCAGGQRCMNVKGTEYGRCQ